MSTEPRNRHSPRFGQIAVDKGFITGEQLKEGLVLQVEDDITNRPHRLLAEMLLEKGWITRRQVLEVLSEVFRAARSLNADLPRDRKLEEQLYTLSITDELTGLFNRRGFFTVVEHRLKVAKRRKTDFLLLYADLDNLWEINKEFGHEEGDKLLKESAAILTSTYRDADIIARIGGDEFVVFPVGSQRGHSETITSRLQEKIDSYNAGKSGYRLSMSIGVATYDPESVDTIDAVIAQANELIREQKKSKKTS